MGCGVVEEFEAKGIGGVGGAVFDRQRDLALAPS